MGRIRVVVAVVAGMVGVTSIALGVRIATRPPARTLSANVIPDAASPRAEVGERDAVTTETTFDLAVLAPPSPAAPAASTPKTTPTTAGAGTPVRKTAIVRVDNATATPLKVVLSDDSEHQAIVAPGDGVTWTVKTSSAHADSGVVRVNGTNCGSSWSGVNNILAGHEYHLEVRPSIGFCAGGQALPVLALTDYTSGASKTIAGLVPDASHALVYIVNRYTAAAKVTLDAVETIEWTMDASAWGATQVVSTTVDGEDTAHVARTDDPACGNRDDVTHFAAGHTYRIEVVAGSVRCASGTGPALAIYDLTAHTTTTLD